VLELDAGLEEDPSFFCGLCRTFLAEFALHFTKGASEAVRLIGA